MVLRMNGSFSGLKKYIKAQTEAIVCVGRGKKEKETKKHKNPRDSTGHQKSLLETK